jgi:hypothetical protein
MPDAPAPAKRPFALATLASESAVYGVVLVSGLMVIVANQSDAEAGEVLLKVVGTSVVFWLAHVYAGAVADLGHDHGEDDPRRPRLVRALRHSIEHSWGLLVAAVVPAVILGLGVVGLIRPEAAIWGTLWVDVTILAFLGYWGVSRWEGRWWARVLGAAATALLGVALILLKALIH